MSEAVKKSVCVWCKGDCGVLVHVKDGHLVKAVEDPDWPDKVWPATRGCARLRAAKEWFYHPDRVNFPLKRAGEKGEGKWQRIPWEQALDEIAEKLLKIRGQYGAEGIARSMGTTYKGEVELFARFLAQMGCPMNQCGGANICFFPRATVANSIVGMFPHFSVKAVTKCILLLGSEPLMSRPGPSQRMIEALRRGAKLIVIDPRRTLSASKADVWLQLRPSTDGALLMGMINVLIKEGLYDKPFVEKWCYGFDELAKRAGEFPLDRVAAITDVAEEKIVEAARLFVGNHPGSIVEGMGIEELTSNAEVLHARWILAALAGNIDIEGGEELTGQHPKIITMLEVQPQVRPSQDQLNKQLGSDRFKLLSWRGQQLVGQTLRKVWPRPPLQFFISHGPALARTIISSQPYPIRALMSFGSNPMVTNPNVKLIYKALKSLDLYVVSDMWMTPSAELADYVLPCASWMERPILWDFNGYDRYMKAGETALPSSIPGEYDHRGDFEVWRELSVRMGFAENWPWKTLEEYYDVRLKPTGYTHSQYVNQVRCEVKTPGYKKYEKVGFATATGKVELYSKIFEKLGYDPLPQYRESAETPASDPEMAKEYPFNLITGGRVREYFHSDFKQIDSVRKRHPYPLLQIHPETARKLGIDEGDWVWIETLRGKVRNKATLFDGIRPDTVHAEHGWWLPELPGEEPWLHGVWEVNANVLLNDDPDICNPLTGGFPLKTALCKVYPVKDYCPAPC